MIKVEKLPTKQIYLLLVLLMDKDIVIVRISKDFSCAITQIVYFSADN